MFKKSRKNFEPYQNIRFFASIKSLSASTIDGLNQLILHQLCQESCAWSGPQSWLHSPGETRWSHSPGNKINGSTRVFSQDPEESKEPGTGNSWRVLSWFVLLKSGGDQVQGNISRRSLVNLILSRGSLLDWQTCTSQGQTSGSFLSSVSKIQPNTLFKLSYLFKWFQNSSINNHSCWLTSTVLLVLVPSRPWTHPSSESAWGESE